MRTVQSMAIWLAGFLCVTATALLVYIGTLQMTVLDRDVVKGWLVQGGVYKNNLVPTLIQSGAAHTEQPDPTVDASQFAIPKDALKIALERTFTKDFVRTQAETTIDSFYNWLEGKTMEFAVSIPIDQKRDTFINELALASEPSIAALPVCGPKLTANTLCRPANIAPNLYSQQVIAQNINESGFFNKPITLNDAKNDVPGTRAPLAIPPFLPYISPIIIGLMVVFVLSAASSLWLAPVGNKLRATAGLGKRIFLAQIFTLVGALLLLLAFSSGFFKFSTMLPDQPAVVSETIGSVVKVAFTTMATTLAIFSGIVCVTALIIWIGIHFWLRKSTRIATMEQVDTPPDLPTTPPSPTN